jgi:hypothetical protein
LTATKVVAAVDRKARSEPFRFIQSKPMLALSEEVIQSLIH